MMDVELVLLGALTLVLIKLIESDILDWNVYESEKLVLNKDLRMEIDMSDCWHTML